MVFSLTKESKNSYLANELIIITCFYIWSNFTKFVFPGILNYKQI